MNFLCLCPTYGKPPRLINNAIACFVNQDHQGDNRLLIFDDLGNYANCGDDEKRWSLISTNQRRPFLTEKYHFMLGLAFQLYNHNWKWDALAVWDDDDIYLPFHLRASEAAIAKGGTWSYPTEVWSTYGNLHREATGGRFHGSLAVGRSYFESKQGWEQTKRADFDQRFISRLGPLYAGNPIGPNFPVPSYVYRWADTQAVHCSGHMSSPENETWYDRVATNCYTKEVPVADIRPEHDQPTVEVLLSLGFSAV